MTVIIRIKEVMIILKFFQCIWKVIDVIFYVASIAFFVWGFFRVSTTVGIFSLGFAFIILGLLSEAIAGQKGGGR